MSHTNTTSNYNLPQFVGTDKPAWLTDINQAFSAIDTAIKNTSDTANTASGNATTANNNIGDPSQLTTQNKTNLVNAINETVVNVTTAQQTANSATSTATLANTNANKALTEISNINLTSFNDLTVTTTNGSVNTANVKVAKNSDGSLAKIYGSIYMTGMTSTATVTISDTGLRPEEDIIINGACLAERFMSSGDASIYPQSYTIKTNGTVEISVYGQSSEAPRNYIFLEACLLFIKQFGDTPIQN